MFFCQGDYVVPRKKRLRYRARASKIARDLGITIDLENWNEIWTLLDEHMERVKPDFLYAIADWQGQLVKFGRSHHPGMRLKAIRTGNCADLKLWAFCEHKSPFTEREVHKQLKEFRINGEWFRLTDEARAIINKMREVSGV